jgi:two-component system OmpR family response regulator
VNPQPRAPVLIVDDDGSLASLLSSYLSGYGIDSHIARDVKEALEAAGRREYSMVLLDLGLPDGDGVDLTRRWREEQRFPIICMSGRQEEADRVMGLEIGADDYVVKPFSLREVLARMRAVWRRTDAVHRPVTRGKHPRAYRFDGWELNINTRRLRTADGRDVSLSSSQFNLLVMFLGAPGTIVTREQLIERTRAFDDVYDRSIDVQMLRLRRKIEVDPKQPALLRTERGMGYYFDAVSVEAIWD